jgi:RNA polymerase sigma-70 factor (ECF subfamily)
MLLRLIIESKTIGGESAKVDYEELYNAYYMKVYYFIMTLAKNQDVSEEITQKTFFKALNTGKKHRGDSSEFTWLCAIAKNLFADEQRASARFAEPNALVDSGTNIENSFVDEDTAFRVHKVLHGLEEPYKEVFQLRVFGELSFQKIGLIFDKTENWARVTYHRARLKIQERMEIK